MNICPVCGAPVPANEAHAYGGRHEACYIGDARPRLEALRSEEMLRLTASCEERRRSMPEKDR